jgi:hypothetical protein
MNNELPYEYEIRALTEEEGEGWLEVAAEFSKEVPNPKKK